MTGMPALAIDGEAAWICVLRMGPTITGILAENSQEGQDCSRIAPLAVFDLQFDLAGLRRPPC
jgi:hypothetical protein